MDGQDAYNRKVALIGSGNMGQAILAGLAYEGVRMDRVTIVGRKKERLVRLKKRYGVDTTLDAAEAERKADLVLFAVKPQVISKVCSHLVPSREKVYVSVAAGVPLARLRRMLGDVMIVRGMPNLACAVAEGITCLAFSENCTDAARTMVLDLFGLLGKTLEMDEDLMDAVTGLSGTGPMYAFIVIEALSDAGVKVGLSRHDANILAAQTVFGAAKMVVESDDHPIDLKDKVTSPGGTAISALHVMEKSGIRAIFMDAVEAATRRAAELGLHNEER